MGKECNVLKCFFVFLKVGMIQVNDNDNLSPDTRSLMENEVKLLLKVSRQNVQYMPSTMGKSPKSTRYFLFFFLSFFLFLFFCLSLKGRL